MANQSVNRARRAFMVHSPESRSLLSAPSARLFVTCTTPTRAGLFRPLTLSRPRAHKEVAVNRRRGREVAREKQLLGLPVGEDDRTAFVRRRVDRGTQIRRGRPGREHALSGRNPNVVGRRRAKGVESRTEPVRVEVDLQPIGSDGGVLVGRISVQLWYWNRRAPGPIRRLLAHVDVAAGVDW